MNSRLWRALNNLSYDSINLAGSKDLRITVIAMRLTRFVQNLLAFVFFSSVQIKLHIFNVY